MELRILGAHNFESRNTRMASYLVDGVLALDAGSLTRVLTFQQQSGIKAILLSHHHFDHIRDLWTLGFHIKGVETTIDIYGIDDTIDYVRSTLLNTHNAPDFTKVPSPDNPTFRFRTINFYEEFRVLGYDVLALPVPHSVPAAGYQVSDGSVKLFYTGDTGKGLSGVWSHVSPDVLLSEVTYGNENEAHAVEVGHLTPELLGKALDDFKAELGYLPIVLATHINPPWEDAVRSGLKELSKRLGIEIIVSESDMIMKL